MSENIVPNTPTSSKLRTPTKATPSDLEKKVAHQQQLLENYKKTNDILLDFMSKAKDDIDQYTSKVTNQETETKERIEKATRECQTKLNNTIEHLKIKVDAAKNENLFEATELVKLKLCAANIQTDLTSLQTDFKNDFALFIDDFRSEFRKTKTAMRNMFKALSEEELANMSEENAELQDKIKYTVQCIGMQIQASHKRPVSISETSNTYEEEKKEFAEQGTDASEVPEQVLCISDYIAKWMLENAKILSN